MATLLSIVDALPRASIPQAYGPLAFIGGWLLVGLALFLASQAVTALAPARISPGYRRRAPGGLELATTVTAGGLALALAALLAGAGGFLLISILPL